MSDVLDILETSRPNIEETPTAPIAKRGPKPKAPKPPPIVRKKPEGMHRELFALLNTCDSDAPLLPTDYGLPVHNEYKQTKANLGLKQPRKWKLKEFTNSARKDSLILRHWERQDVTREDYLFAKYNTKIDSHIPKYDDNEYNSHLICDQWTKEETDHLMQLCSRFDLRFMVIHDRWDRTRFKVPRDVEDLKERYYFVHNQLAKSRTTRTIDTPKLKPYDAEQERKRKQQLNNLYNRSKEEIEEEASLLNELRKIDQKKKERERRMQDLQKQMDADRSASDHHHRRSDHSTPASVGRPSGSGMRGMPGRRPGRGAGRPSRDSIASLNNTSQSSSVAMGPLELNTINIKFNDFKTSGTSLRSQRFKLPPSLGSKKLKALEQMTHELGLDQMPMPTEEICQQFNELRGDLVLLYELKVNLANTEFEIQSLKNQISVVKPGLVPDEPATDQSTANSSTPDTSARDISDVIDINTVNTPGRKRKAALEQSNVIRGLKMKRTL